MTRQERFLAKAGVIASLMLGAGALAALLVFGYFFYYYSWTGSRQLSGWSGVAVYYASPLLAATVLLIALRLKRDVRINLAILGVTLVLSLFGGELVLQLLEAPLSRSQIPVMASLQGSKDKPKLAARLAKEYGVEIDARSGLEVITELRASGVDAVPSVIPKYQLRDRSSDEFRILALGGISDKVTVLCNESGQYVTYRSDEHGFRNPAGIASASRVDVVALGDSFTQGYCVPTGKEFVGIVRERFPATLNLGMAGEGPLLMLATLREYALPLKPRVVLWFYFEGNDLIDLQEERQSALLQRYLEGSFSQELRQRQPEVNGALAAFVERETARERARREGRRRVQRSRLAELVDLVKLPALRSRLGLVQGRSSEEVELAAGLTDLRLDLFREALSRTNDAVATWGGKLYFVYLPNWTRFDRRGGALDQRLAEAQRDNVLAVVRALQMPVVDVLPAFEAQRDPMAMFPFRAPGHYNEDGHRLVAEEVLKAVPASMKERRQ